MSITEERVVAFLSSFYRPRSEALHALREECEVARVPLILRETESCLTALLSAYRPRKILEIGAAFGYSSLFFAELLPNATITTIERDAAMLETAACNIAAHGKEDRIRLLAGDAADLLADPESVSDEAEDAFDFVFIDAAKSHYRTFFDLALPLCRRGAMIVCDNILMKGSLADREEDWDRRHRTSIRKMTEFLHYIQERNDLEVSLLSCGDGLAVIRYDD